mmetsp:Transcript_13704/g.25700  ORF Transcript_13704/g.25700 Transcript_13704/m.25700 type:complete len:121 (+) Transcript_13704:140-502(+)
MTTTNNLCKVNTICQRNTHYCLGAKMSQREVLNMIRLQNACACNNSVSTISSPEGQFKSHPGVFQQLTPFVLGKHFTGDSKYGCNVWEAWDSTWVSDENEGSSSQPADFQIQLLLVGSGD